MATLDRKKMLGRKNLIKMFNMLDKDRSGSIDLKELKKAFGG
jgi:Ca2+-binding EF-hand superfamily protein